MTATATIWAARPSPIQDWDDGAHPEATSAATGHGQGSFRTHQADWEKVAKKIEGFLQLQDDWDGAGARKLDPVIIDFCVALAKELAKKPDMAAPCVSPTVEGGIVLQWQGEFGRLEAEVNEPCRVECMLSVRGQKPKHWILPS